jgi:hypothetical protein
MSVELESYLYQLARLKEQGLNVDVLEKETWEKIKEQIEEKPPDIDNLSTNTKNQSFPRKKRKESTPILS